MQCYLLDQDTALHALAPRRVNLCTPTTHPGPHLQGCFKRAIKGGYGASEPNLPAVLPTLMEIALALRHLHLLQLVHCDLKPANVLLKSSLTDPRGFTSKLSDFGLVKICIEEAVLEGLAGAPRRRMSGTITHLPPEMLAGNLQVGVACCAVCCAVVLCCGVRVHEGRWLIAMTRV
jgi:hypothetical protein